MDTVRVEFAPGALNAIKADVIHGYKSIPRRGAEVGGLLCGTIVETGPLSLVRIHTVVPEAIEHRFGPSYRLCDADKQRFRQLALEWAPRGAIGWYRSQLRSDEAPAPEDRTLSAELFPGRSSAFLVCYPDATLNVPGKLCVWVGGQNEDSTRIDLGRYSLMEEAMQAAESGAPDEAALEPEKPKHMAPPERPVQRQPQPVQRGRLAVVGTLVLGISFCAYLVHARLKPAPEAAAQPHSAGLGMKVNRDGDQLLVSWNRQAPEILQASDGSFRISNGDRIRMVSLSPHELRTGSLMYTAPRGSSGDDVQMELDVSGPGGDFVESVRVVGDAPVPPPVQPVRAAPVSPPPSADPAPPRKKLRAFAAPPRPKNKTGGGTVGILPEAPVLGSAINPVPASVLMLPELPKQAPVTSAEYTPPRPKKSVQPVISTNSLAVERAFEQTQQSHEVQIDVSIDERGMVTNAAVGATAGAFGYLFVDPALSAARQWQFVPATRGGRPVPSKMTLKFTFVKNDR